VVDIDSKSNKIKNLLEILDNDIKILNDAGLNGDVFAIKIDERRAETAPQNQVGKSPRKRVRLVNKDVGLYQLNKL